MDLQYIDCAMATTVVNQSDICKKIHEANINAESTCDEIKINKNKQGVEYANASIQKKYPGSSRLEDLETYFQECVKKFINAIKDAGGNVQIFSTLRPPERAYLMNKSPQIASNHNEAQSKAIAEDSKKKPVDVDWAYFSHGEQSFSTFGCIVVNISNCKNIAYINAKDLTQSFSIVYPASLISNHCKGLAIDMRITFPDNKDSITIIGGDGRNYTVINDKTDLYSLKSNTLRDAGASFGVIRFHKPNEDGPHWSVNGR